jgi:hypothetical protein
LGSSKQANEELNCAMAALYSPEVKVQLTEKGWAGLVLVKSGTEHGD